MKRLIAATIAFSLLGSTAALAHGWHNHESYDGRGYGYEQSDNVGPIIAAGLGIAALTIISSQHDHHHYRHYHDGRYYGGSGYYHRRDHYRGHRSYRRYYYHRNHGRWNGYGERSSYRHD